MSGLDDPVCASCGVPVNVNTRTRQVYHIDSIPEGVDEHDATGTVERRAYLFGESQAAQQRAAGSPGERSAAALERIATLLEILVARGSDPARSVDN